MNKELSPLPKDRFFQEYLKQRLLKMLLITNDTIDLNKIPMIANVRGDKNKRNVLKVAINQADTYYRSKKVADVAVATYNITDSTT